MLLAAWADASAAGTALADPAGWRLMAEFRGGVDTPGGSFYDGVAPDARFGAALHVRSASPWAVQLFLERAGLRYGDGFRLTTDFPWLTISRQTNTLTALHGGFGANYRFPWRTQSAQIAWGFVELRSGLIRHRSVHDFVIQAGGGAARLHRESVGYDPVMGIGAGFVFPLSAHQGVSVAATADRLLFQHGVLIGLRCSLCLGR